MYGCVGSLSTCSCFNAFYSWTFIRFPKSRISAENNTKSTDPHYVLRLKALNGVCRILFSFLCAYFCHPISPTNLRFQSKKGCLAMPFPLCWMSSFPTSSGKVIRIVRGPGKKLRPEASQPPLSPEVGWATGGLDHDFDLKERSGGA